MAQNRYGVRYLWIERSGNLRWRTKYFKSPEARDRFREKLEQSNLLSSRVELLDPNPKRKTEGDFALYTDAGLVAWGITKKRAETMARKIRHGSAKIATTSGRIVKVVRENPRKSRVSVKNFTGTVVRKHDGTVSVKGIGRRG